MKRIIFKVLSGILIGLLLGFFVCKGIMLFATSRLLTPSELKNFSAWKKTQFTFTQGMLNPDPFSKETVQAAQAFRAAYDALHVKAEALVTSPTENPHEGFPVIWDDARFRVPAARLDELTSLTTAFEILVARPDYTLEADVAGLDWKGLSAMTGLGGEPHASSDQALTMSRLMCLQAVRLAREGDSDAAFSKVNKVIKSSRVERYDPFITHLISNSHLAFGVRAWSYAVDHCQDVQRLRQELREQNRLGKDPLPLLCLDPNQIRHLDATSGLRWLSRQGVPITVSTCTGPELYRLYFARIADYQIQSVLPKYQKDRVPQARLDGLLESIRRNCEWALATGPADVQFGQFYWQHKRYCGNSFSTAFVTHDLQQAGYFKFGVNGIDDDHLNESIVRARTVASKVALLRLKTARKLYRLEHGGEAPANPISLVPEYLNEVPQDPFAKDGKGLQFSDVGYSIGPDGKDQKLGIEYDPTNGAFSAGDLILK